MDMEQLSTMTEAELHARANAHLEHLDIETESHHDKEHHVSQAQFYLAELDRRDQAKERRASQRIARRDFWLEIGVIVLIGAELIEGNKQTAVLDKLNQSSAATAATLTAVRQAQEASLETQKHTLENITAMNDALQNESDLNLLDVLQCSGSDSQGHIYLGNRGKASLFLWGSRYDSRSPVMQRTATVIPYGGSHTLDVSRLSKELFGETGDAPQRVVPYELYLKTANGKKYVGTSSFQIARIKGSLSIYGLAISITRKEW
jgi:hypothetical protein